MAALLTLLTLSSFVQNVGVIASAIGSLYVVVPYLKIGVIYTYKGIAYVAVKTKDGTVALVQYIKNKV